MSRYACDIDLRAGYVLAIHSTMCTLSCVWNIDRQDGVGPWHVSMYMYIVCFFFCFDV